MIIDLITLFPGICDGPARESIIRRAREAGHLDFRVHNLRDYAHDRHRTVDDRPFGGGPGMVLMPGPLVEAIESVSAMDATPPHVIYLSPQGTPLRQARVRELAQLPRLLLISGHYEGIDERVREGWVHEEISIGDYVLTNGTLPALVLVDAVTRLLPGVLGNEESALYDSFADHLLEGPQYTRPENFRGRCVPDILLSGHHARIQQWRRERAEERTRRVRGDLSCNA